MAVKELILAIGLTCGQLGLPPCPRVTISPPDDSIPVIPLAEPNELRCQDREARDKLDEVLKILKDQR